MDVASNEYVLSMASNAENIWFIVQELIIVSVMLHCAVMQYQLFMQNNGGVSSLVAEK